MKFKKLALLAMSTLALAACGGSNISVPEIPPIVPVAPVAPAIDAALHIKGTVDGVNFNANDWLNGTLDTRTKLVNLDARLPKESESGNSSSWGIYGLEAKIGKYYCGSEASDDNSIGIGFYNAATNEYIASAYGSRGKCEVIVEDFTAEEISGRFTVTLVRESSDKTVTVEDGTFRVRLKEHRPV